AVVRTELVQIGLGRIHPQVPVGVGAPTKRVDHEFIEQHTSCAIRLHHQTGIEDPETRVVVLVAAEFAPIAMDTDPSNSEFDAGVDSVRSPGLLLVWIGRLNAGRRRCRLSGNILIAATGSPGLSLFTGPGLFLAFNYPCAA